MAQKIPPLRVFNVLLNPHTRWQIVIPDFLLLHPPSGSFCVGINFTLQAHLVLEEGVATKNVIFMLD
jgi:hypothetical protein